MKILVMLHTFGGNGRIVCLYMAVTIALASVAVPGLAMSAYYLTDPEYVDEGGKQFWQIRVTCTDLNTKRFLVRSQDTDPWCAKHLLNFCSSDKAQAAINLCSQDYNIALDLSDAKQQKLEQDPVAEVNRQASDKFSLLQQQALIQSLQVELGQRKLDLRRREIELQKREIDMHKRIDTRL